MQGEEAEMSEEERLREEEREKHQTQLQIEEGKQREKKTPGGPEKGDGR